MQNKNKTKEVLKQLKKKKYKFKITSLVKLSNKTEKQSKKG